MQALSEVLLAHNLNNLIIFVVKIINQYKNSGICNLQMWMKTGIFDRLYHILLHFIPDFQFPSLAISLTLNSNIIFKPQNMIQKLQKPTDQTQPTSPPSSNYNNLNQILLRDPLLLEYFQNYSACYPSWKLAHQLMLDGLRYRAKADPTSRSCCCNPLPIRNTAQSKQQSSQKINNQVAKPNKVKGNFEETIKINDDQPREKEKRHNVTYVKHNRFLSPKQRNEVVTPKVTEVIPIKMTSPLRIYGKPRVRIDDECGCPYHNNEEQCYRSIPYASPCGPRTPSKPLHQIHVKEGTLYNQICQEPHLVSRFKSSPNIKSQFREIDQNLNKIQKNTNLPHNQKSNKLKKTTQRQTGQIVYVDRIVQVQSRVPGKMKIVRSSQVGKQPLENKQVQSKIKFLIERDKKNKEIQNSLKRQEKKIKVLEKLIKLDKNLQKPEKKTIKITSNDILSLSSDSSQMSMMNSTVMENYKVKVGKNGSAGHFGMQELEDCDDCSKTFSESEADTENNEEFSDFRR